jgi:hypothetical protein
VYFVAISHPNAVHDEICKMSLVTMTHASDGKFASNADPSNFTPILGRCCSIYELNAVFLSSVSIKDDYKCCQRCVCAARASQLMHMCDYVRDVLTYSRTSKSEAYRIMPPLFIEA